MNDEISVADDHYHRMMWEYGNPRIMDSEPFCDTPDFGGWRAYLLRHADDTPEQRIAAREVLNRSGFRLHCTFKCQYCEQGITFINHKPFDTHGAHRCLAEGRGSLANKKGGST